MWVSSCRQLAKIYKNHLALLGMLESFDQVFDRKFLVLFLMRVKTITTQAMIQGGKLPPVKLNFCAHCGVSLMTSTIKRVITATPTSIFVIGLIKESWNQRYKMKILLIHVDIAKKLSQPSDNSVTGKSYMHM